ncbi:MAG: CTP synthase, partial [Candidatus Paceibacterota bacterium]
MAKNKNIKYIFVVGGVMSGVGKGIASSSIGKILQSRGLAVSSIKIDPYVNVDAGTMNPTEHGEVFVLDDGTECDQDIGNYERFLERSFNKDNYMTTGSLYKSVIEKERNLEYKGKCVSVVPHIPLEVINKIDKAAKKDKANVIITEIGGTVGEYENILFLEAMRMLKNKKPNDVCLVLVSFLPLLKHVGELKTKPTQHAVRSLHYTGLQPDIIIARAREKIDEKRKDKIAFNCGVDKKDVISAPDISNIYEVPLNFEKDKLSDNLLDKLKLSSKTRDLKKWKSFVKKTKKQSKEIKIGIVGKYFKTGEYILGDSYVSVIEAVKHAAAKSRVTASIEWLSAGDFENKRKLSSLKKYDGIIVPGGFGSRSINGKINVIQYCRENKVPYLGLCYGMQLALVEFARNVCGLKGANTVEIDENTKYPVIDFLPDQVKTLKKDGYGGTMRLGAYNAIIKKDTIAHSAYKKTEISERHRHR